MSGDERTRLDSYRASHGIHLARFRIIGAAVVAAAAQHHLAPSHPRPVGTTRARKRKKKKPRPRARVQASAAQRQRPI